MTNADIVNKISFCPSFFVNNFKETGQYDQNKIFDLMK